jgi:hypothetical protein
VPQVIQIESGFSRVPIHAVLSHVWEFARTREPLLLCHSAAKQRNLLLLLDHESQHRVS